jgi:hypothetical protein
MLPAAIRPNHHKPGWWCVSSDLLYCDLVFRPSRDLAALEIRGEYFRTEVAHPVFYNRFFKGLILLCRPNQFSRSSFVDDSSRLIASSLPFLLYTMSLHRDIYT